MITRGPCFPFNACYLGMGGGGGEGGLYGRRDGDDGWLSSRLFFSFCFSHAVVSRTPFLFFCSPRSFLTTKKSSVSCLHFLLSFFFFFFFFFFFSGLRPSVHRPVCPYTSPPSLSLSLSLVSECAKLHRERERDGGRGEGRGRQGEREKSEAETDGGGGGGGGC